MFQSLSVIMTSGTARSPFYQHFYYHRPCNFRYDTSIVWIFLKSSWAPLDVPYRCRNYLRLLRLRIILSNARVGGTIFFKILYTAMPTERNCFCVISNNTDIRFSGILGDPIDSKPARLKLRVPSIRYTDFLFRQAIPGARYYFTIYHAASRSDLCAISRAANCFFSISKRKRSMTRIFLLGRLKCCRWTQKQEMKRYIDRFDRG